MLLCMQKWMVFALVALMSAVACGDESEAPVYALEGESCDNSCAMGECERRCDSNVLYQCSEEGVYFVLEDCDETDASCVMFTSGGEPETGPTGPPLTVECQTNQ